MLCACLSEEPEPCVWWIDFGTLLGIIRDGDIIFDDNDVDICLLMPSGEEDAILDVLEKRLHGRYGRTLHRRCAGSNITRPSTHGLEVASIDLYHVRVPPQSNDDTEFEAMYLGATGPNSDIPTSLVGRPRWHWWSAGGMHVRIPQHPRAVLEWRYGPQWRTPRQKDKGRDAQQINMPKRMLRYLCEYSQKLGFNASVCSV